MQVRSDHRKATKTHVEREMIKVHCCGIELKGNLSVDALRNINRKARCIGCFAYFLILIYPFCPFVFAKTVISLGVYCRFRTVGKKIFTFFK